MRTIQAILVEEGVYVTALALAFLVGVYRYGRKKGWLRSLKRTRDSTALKEAAPAKKVTPTKAATPTQKNGPSGSQPTPRHSGTESPEEAVSHEIRLQRTIARLQDRSSQDPMTTFDTTRLRREVMEPLQEFLSEIEKINMAPSAISCKYHLRMEGLTGGGKQWTDFEEEMPVEVANLNVDGFLNMRVSKSREQESEIVEFQGWFVGDGDGSWKISNREMRFGVGRQNREYEVPMYDWYQLKQRISQLVADFLDGLTD